MREDNSLDLKPGDLVLCSETHDIHYVIISIYANRSGYLHCSVFRSDSQFLRTYPLTWLRKVSNHGKG